MNSDECSKNYERGILLCDVGRYAEGLRSFNRAQECLDQNNAEEKKHHALILIAEGGALELIGERSPRSRSKSLEKSLECFNKAIEILDPTESKEYLALAFFNKGYTLGQMRKYEEASKIFDQAIVYYRELNKRRGKFKTEYANALRNRGFVTAMSDWYRHNSEKTGYDKAIEDLDKAVDLDESFALAYNTKGYIYEIYGEYENAKKCFDRAIELDPYLGVAWYNKGYATFELEIIGNHSDETNKNERYQEAIGYIDNAIIIDPKISCEWYYKGCVLYRGLGKYKEAMKCFDKALELNPNFAYSWYYKGLVLIELERYREAIECFDGAYKNLDSGEREEIAFVLLNKAAAFDSLGEKDENYFRKALDCYKEAIEIFENIRGNSLNGETKNDVNMWLALSYHGKGFTYGNLKQYRDALEWFSKALTYYQEIYNIEDVIVRTEYANTLRNMGFVYSKLDNYAEAERCFMESVSIAPEFGYAWNSKGFHTLEHYSKYPEKLNEAISDFDKAIRCFEEDKDKSNSDSHIFYPYYYKGHALYRLNDYNAAIKCFDNAIKIRPDDVDARLGKGLSYYSIGKENREKREPVYELRKFEEAVKCFDEAIRIKSSHLGWYYKAVTLYSMKRYDEAVKSFEETTKLKPDDVYAWYYKALTLYNMKRYEEAVHCFNVIYDTFKRNRSDNNELIELVASALCYKGNANYWLGKNNEEDGVDENDDEIQKSYQRAVECHDEALILFSNDIGSNHGLNKCDILFDRGVFKFYMKDFSRARLDFEKAIKEETTNSKKSRIYNNIGMCYLNAGKKFYKEAEDSFLDAIKIDSTQGIAYYNLAALYCKESKQDKAKEILDDSKAKHPLIEEAKEKLKDRSELDWYNWWFSQSKIKKALGVTLILVLLVPFIGTALLLYQGSLEEYETIYDIFSKKAETLMGGFITIMAIIIGILLLPSLHKLKVGTAIEFEKDSPRFADSTETSFRPKFQFVPNVLLPELPKFRLPIERHKGKSIMPLKYQRQRLLMPTAFCHMPTRMSF